MPSPPPDVELPDIALEESPYGAVIAADLAVIQELDLRGISREKKVIRRVPWDDQLTCPYVSLSLYPETVDADAGPAGKDEILYNVMLAIVSANNGNIGTTKLGTILYWRWLCMKAFLNKRISVSLPSGVCEVRTIVTAGEPMIPAAIRQNRDAQYWLIQHKLQEVR